MKQFAMNMPVCNANLGETFVLEFFKQKFEQGLECI